MSLKTINLGLKYVTATRVLLYFSINGVYLFDDLRHFQVSMLARFVGDELIGSPTPLPSHFAKD